MFNTVQSVIVDPSHPFLNHFSSSSTVLKNISLSLNAPFFKMVFFGRYSQMMGIQYESIQAI